jgi:signal transduction histidine kinase
MLRNLKVGTKLVAILVAPVLVLLAVSYIGVKQRLTDASDAQRVQDLAAFVEDNSELIKELELEGLYSAQFAASAGTISKDPMVAQRAKTDAALTKFNDSNGAVDPGRDQPAVKDALKQADNRIKQLKTIRNSVDGVQNDALGLVDQYKSATDDMLSVSRAVAQSVNDPALARGLSSYVNLAAVTTAEAHTASLLAISSQVGFYASQLPGGSIKEASNPPQALGGAPNATCDALNPPPPAPDGKPDPSAAGDKCKPYKLAIESNGAFSQAEQVFDAGATGPQKQIKRSADAGVKLDGLKKLAFDDGQGKNDLTGKKGGAAVLPADFMPAAQDRIEKLFKAQRQILVDDNESVLTLATNKASEANFGRNLYVLFTAAAVLLAFLITYTVAKAITVPLRKLTSAAYVLSTERLPALVERLRNPEEDTGESLAATLTPIDISSKDEIGQLADSFNSIQQVTVEVAEEQSVLLRKGIGDIFINLARRNQTLLDRQIEFIDQLEANEEDPDQLDNLFKLDHLATRMRRNAESLLVLAGAEPPRRRGRPVALADVVRVAIGEVEDFARIQLLALDDATVGGNVAVDLAHLLSELMENATHFSPPDTMVEIVGHRSETGYIISVSDQGIGMSADQIGEANTQLARPPLVGLALSRSLGFIVIGRLAQRFDISVKLTASPSGGVTALVTLPTDLVTYEGEELPPPAAELAPAAVEPDLDEELANFDQDEVVVLDDDVVVLDDEAADEPLVVASDDSFALDEEVDEPELDEAMALDDDSLLDELVEEGMGDSDEFERGLQSILSDDLASGSTDTADAGSFTSMDEGAATAEATVIDEPATIEAEAEPAEAAPVAKATRAEPIVTVAEQIAKASRAEAKIAELTAAGLVKRTPKKRSAEPVAGDTPTGAQPRATGASQRSPEEVRKMLSRYRSGLNKGRTTADSDNTDS